MPSFENEDFGSLSDLLVDLLGTKYPASYRDLLLEGLPTRFVGMLATNQMPLIQLRLDLQRLNSTERLVGGIIPLELFLRNTAQLFRDDARSKQVREYQLRLSNDLSGAPVAELAEPASGDDGEDVVLDPEVTIGRDAMLPYRFLEGGVRAGRGVGRVELRRFTDDHPATNDDGEPWIVHGSGWLVCPDVFITNFHVINGRSRDEDPATDQELKSQVENAVIRFDFDTTADESGGLPVEVESLLASDAGLDFALLKLRQALDRPIPAVRTEPIKLHRERPFLVNIIQHPGGGPKRVAIRENMVHRIDKTLVRYQTDTEPGSSGSPVFDDVWNVVAIHRAAIRNPAGTGLAFLNGGTRIEAILEHLDSHANSEVVSLTERIKNGV